MSKNFLVDVPWMRGEIVRVEAGQYDESVVLDGAEVLELALVYADGRRVVIAATGYEAEGLTIETNPAGWFKRAREDYHPVKGMPRIKASPKKRKKARR